MIEHDNATKDRTVSEETLQTAIKLEKQNAGAMMRAYFADVPPPSCPEEELILPSRKDFNKNREVDFGE